jgi:hypothetical protein
MNDKENPIIRDLKAMSTDKYASINEQWPTLNQAGWEKIHEPLFDTVDFYKDVSGVFFQLPIGQADKGQEDTNMALAGQLPQRNHFVVRGVGVRLYGLKQDNYERLRAQSLVTFRIGSKEFLRLPTGECSPPNELSPDFDKSKEQHYFFRLIYPLWIQPKQNFMAEFKSPFVDAAGRIQIILDGDRIRPCA